MENNLWGSLEVCLFCSDSWEAFGRYLSMSLGFSEQRVEESVSWSLCYLPRLLGSFLACTWATKEWKTWVNLTHNRCLQLSLGPPFPFHQAILLPSPGMLDPTQRLVFTVPAPLSGCPGAWKTSQAPQTPSFLLGNTPETLLGRWCLLRSGCLCIYCDLCVIEGEKGF